jgi:hypothetical protein
MYHNWGVPAAFLSPMSCWSLPSPQQLAALSAAAAAAAAGSGGGGTPPASCSLQSAGSCSSLGASHVVRKYKRAKSLLQVGVLCCLGVVMRGPLMQATLAHAPPTPPPTRACTPQAQLQETQRIKALLELESHKAAAAAVRVQALEGQLATSNAAVQEAQHAQHELQRQVRRVGAVP